ncbi:DUF262 domain-containing protein [Pseudomonas sp. CDFA 610]|uniref:DUF262 domain-containing protein n=1 Tax=Pseudomonas sp. CDFA 610 TaxID=2829825 RepID=UPI001E2F446E|nr:DUF262 domain-containing protein [Pseudomonas sp. CDFA 610]MCD5985554.1 DUF262 domain-containing protein [Pseudomonas sp. CDFA 610]
MIRRPSTQDVTWLLDLNQNNQIDLNPPYQRRSVWTMRDKQYFLDTVFRNYPSPAIFLHKTISDTGKATYHVVDGKQRIQTILEFVNNKIKMGREFGDVRLDSKKWKDLASETELKQIFWNYQLTVELIDWADGTVVNEVFDRLNRNSRKLTNQELRHAKFDGWFLQEAEAESVKDEWRAIGISTPARAKRMIDTQFISELMLVVLESEVFGFDQDMLDDNYAKYDDPSDLDQGFDPEEFRENFARIKHAIISMEQANNCITRYARGYGNFYALWTALALADFDLDAEALSEKYSLFMSKVETLVAEQNLESFLAQAQPGLYTQALIYVSNSRGASTELNQRKERVNALTIEVLG